ncbi:MAG TPA: hypothetical protein VGM33_06900 [Baekduia sp.]|jgi:hypothetical protein
MTTTTASSLKIPARWPRGAALAERVALVAVAAFLVYLAVRLRAVIGASYANGDNASALVLAQFLGERGHEGVVLGDYRWLEPLYALHLTRWLPAHRQAWEVAPFALYALTVAMAWWTVRRAVSGGAALGVALAMAAPSPIVLGFVGVPNAHAHTLTHSVLLSVFLVTAPGLAARGRPARAAWALALAVTLAAGATSDPLLLVGPVPAFLVACAVGERLKLLRRDVALLGGVACCAGVAAGLGLAAYATHAGIVSSGNPLALATAEQLAPHTRLLLESLALYGHGRIGGPVTVLTAVLELAGLVVMIGVPLLLLRGRTPALAFVTAADRPPAARLLLVFCAVVVAGVGGAFIASASPLDIYATRYTLALWPALLTLWAILAPPATARLALAALASVAAVLGCVQLARGDYTTPTSEFPQGAEVGALERFAAAQHVDHGYAGYWESATITAQTDFGLRLYPVIMCGAHSDGRCPPTVHRLDAWYTPQRRPMRTLYVVDEVALGVGTVVQAPPVRWGAPVAQATFGHLHAWVYDYDLARRLPEGS